MELKDLSQIYKDSINLTAGTDLTEDIFEIDDELYDISASVFCSEDSLDEFCIKVKDEIKEAKDEDLNILYDRFCSLLESYKTKVKELSEQEL